MKSSRNHKLLSRLTHHVGTFWSNSIGLPKSCLVALSGGMDSTLLLEVCANLGRVHGFNVRAIHVDHGTQEKQAMIEAHLQQLCDDNQVELTIVRTELSLMASNFEATARNIRLKLIEKNTKKDEVIVYGHHIDDSFEWSLMQKLRSSQVMSTLGIPLINGKKVRPFMCLTRAQIESIHHKLGLWHFEDISNTNERFSRNHLRRVIKTEFASRYPNYLKHYVHSSNDLAKKLNVSVFKNERFVVKKAEGIRAIFSNNFVGLEEEISNQYKELSSLKRSSERAEIKKICKAFMAGKKGPHNLPGYVKAWGLSGVILLTNEIGELKLINRYDLTSHIPELLPISPADDSIMIAVWNAPKHLVKIGLKSHPLVKLNKNSNVMLLPRTKWLHFVKTNTHKNIKLQWQALNF